MPHPPPSLARSLPPPPPSLSRCLSLPLTASLCLPSLDRCALVLYACVCAAVTQSDVWDFSPIHRAFDMDNEGLVSELEYYIFMLQVFLLYPTRCVMKHCIRPVVS
jgi:hypothetical protein